MVVMTVAPVSLAMRCRSALSTLLRPRTPAWFIYCEAVSSMPILVMMTLAPALMSFEMRLCSTSHYLMRIC